jgi:hypothetical protein
MTRAWGISKKPARENHRDANSAPEASGAKSTTRGKRAGGTPAVRNGGGGRVEGGVWGGVAVWMREATADPSPRNRMRDA